MKFRNEVTIDAGREFVWRLFDDPENLARWQPTLESFTPVSGTPGEPGQVAELVYSENGRKVVMTETLTEKRPPDFIAGSYESAWSTATIVNHFEALGDTRTHWVMYANHRFRGFRRVFAFLLRGSINERTEDWMQRFKLLAETEAAGAGQ